MLGVLEGGEAVDPELVEDAGLLAEEAGGVQELAVRGGLAVGVGGEGEGDVVGEPLVLGPLLQEGLDRVLRDGQARLREVGTGSGCCVGGFIPVNSSVPRHPNDVKVVTGVGELDDGGGGVP